MSSSKITSFAAIFLAASAWTTLSPSNPITVAGHFLILICISWWTSSIIYDNILSKRIPRVQATQRAVFVTGCDSGFGLKSAERLATDGFHVFAGCLSLESKGADTLRGLTSSKITLVKVDVTDPASILNCVQLVEDHLDRNDLYLHSVVNNAGINLPNLIEFHKPSSVADFESVVAVNLLGPLRIARLFLPLLRRTRDSRLINVASQAGRTVTYGNASYAVSKSGLIKLTECLSAETSRFGIRSISIEPFMFKTQVDNLQRLQDHMSRSWSEAFSEVRSSYGGPDKLAEMIKSFGFFSSNESFVNPNIDFAVDMIVDAVTSVDPASVYSRVPFPANLYIWATSTIPYDLQFMVNQHQEWINRRIMKLF